MLRCDESGNIVSFYCEEIPTALYQADCDWHSRFEHRYYHVPNPFDRSSIVMDIDSQELGIVETSQEEWLALEKRVLSVVRSGSLYPAR